MQTIISVMICKRLQVRLSDSRDDAAIVDYRYNDFDAFRHTVNCLLPV